MNILKSYIRRNQRGKGVFEDKTDHSDFKYDGMALSAAPVDWDKGYDVEKELDIHINLKHQGPSSSCVGQGWSYQIAVHDCVETGKSYDEVSAKAVYSQIYLPSGGAYIRDGAKLAVDWGALKEAIIPSYESGNTPPSEPFMREIGWKTPQRDKEAEALKSKEYRVIGDVENIDIVATAIRDNYGVVFGVYGENNGTWNSNEPKPPSSDLKRDWAHCIYGGKYGRDNISKWVSIPNSWGTRGSDSLHPDGWQKLRPEYFNKKIMFNPWTLTDKPNFEMSDEAKRVLAQNEKKIIMEAEAPGRKGIVINGELREITNDRQSAACLYALVNNNFGVPVNKKIWEELTKGNNF